MHTRTQMHRLDTLVTRVGVNVFLLWLLLLLLLLLLLGLWGQLWSHGFEERVHHCLFLLLLLFLSLKQAETSKEATKGHGKHTDTDTDTDTQADGGVGTVVLCERSRPNAMHTAKFKQAEGANLFVLLVHPVTRVVQHQQQQTPHKTGDTKP